jgi:hypothetical protein
MGRNSVDATNALRMRNASAEGRRFRLRLTVDFFLLAVPVVFLAEVAFLEEAAGFDWLLDLCVVDVEEALGVSDESDDCERTGTMGNKATKTPAKTRGAGTKNDEKQNFMVSL